MANGDRLKKVASLKFPPLSTPNMVAVIGLVAIALLIALRTGFRPINLS